jgi:hypothetical protein
MGLTEYVELTGKAYIQGFGRKTRMKKYQQEDLCVYWRVTLNFILEKHGEGMKWIKLAKLRGQWTALMYTAISLRGLYNCGIFVSG